MAQRNWLATLNNPDDIVAPEFLEMIYEKTNAVYVCGQVEKGEEGTVHIQYFLNVKKPMRLAALKKICARSHFEPVKVNNGADDYCLKENSRVEGPWEFGKKPFKRNSKADWEEQWKLAKAGEFEKMDKQYLLQSYTQARQIAKDFMPQGRTARENPRQCLWLYGQPGTGKTRFCHENHPNHFQKLANKWWDGYQQEDAAVLDDIGKDVAKALVNHLKLWADPWYNHPGEIKGSQVRLNHDIFIVTSNYSIQELEISEVDKAALERRFEIINFDNR